jgi:hypothetical protein|nr:MAG TPA: hypothetical protein [Caudoviricetes sp.]
MTRRQFLGRLFQYYITIRNSQSIYGIYHPWVQRPIGSEVTVHIGYFDSYSFHETGSRKGIDSRYYNPGAGLSEFQYTFPIFCIYDISKENSCTKENMIYCNAKMSKSRGGYKIDSYSSTTVKTNNGSYLIPVGRYKLQIILSGAGYNFSQTEYYFEITDCRGNDNAYSSGIQYYNIPTKHIYLECGFDYIYYDVKQDKKIINGAEHYKKVGTIPISNEIVDCGTAIEVLPRFKYISDGLFFDYYIQYHRVSNGSTNWSNNSDSNLVNIGTLKYNRGYSQSKDLIFVYNNGNADAYQYNSLDSSFWIDNTLSSYVSYIPHLGGTAWCVYQYYNIYNPNDENYCPYVSLSGGNLTVTRRKYVGTYNSFKPRPYAENSFVEMQIFQGKKDVSIMENINNLVAMLPEYDQDFHSRKERTDNHTCHKPIYNNGQVPNESIAAVNKEAPDGCDVYYFTYNFGSYLNGSYQPDKVIQIPAKELQNGYSEENVSIIKRTPSFSSVIKDGGYVHDRTWTIETDWDEQETKISKFTGNIDWTGYECHTIDNIWEGNMLYRPNVIEYGDSSIIPETT